MYFVDPACLRGTSSSACLVRNGPVPSRRATIAPASPSLTPETRASSGAEAVLTSTPTALTQLSTTWSSAFFSVG